MSVERLTALLAALAPRRLGDIVLHDPEGPSRVVARFPTFADYVDLAIGQIRRYGASESQVAYALLRLLRVAGAQTRDSHWRQVLATHARVLLVDRRTHHLPARGSGPSAERGRDPTPGTGSANRVSEGRPECQHFDRYEQCQKSQSYEKASLIHGIYHERKKLGVFVCLRFERESRNVMTAVPCVMWCTSSWS